jgi:hypothetical protein
MITHPIKRKRAFLILSKARSAKRVSEPSYLLEMKPNFGNLTLPVKYLDLTDGYLM